MHVNLDPQLVDKIANEVKSQGVFDQFRKDSMADVDTKPAYQNLRQRVENTVNKFLSEQKWTPELNKNQLRERLRKHITEAGFLDVGVERIVDQVVNPKISTVFQPKIEDIAYKYLGIPKPQVKVTTSEVPTLNGMLTIETNLMPTDLEQVSPDSDKCSNKSDLKDDTELDDKIDDFESPPFEPIEIKPNTDDIEMQEDKKKGEFDAETIETVTDQCSTAPEEMSVDNNAEKVKVEPSAAVKMEEERDVIVSGEASQESQLSQVSSDSRLSIVTNDNTQEEENNVNISEEAQMPKFNENSNSSSEKKSTVQLHFDINKDEIKFEGTERKIEPPTEELSPNTSEEIRLDSSLENKSVDNTQNNPYPLPSQESSFEKEKEFKFSKIEVNVDLEEVTKTTSLDDSADRELQIIEKSEMSQCSVSQQSIKSPTFRQEKTNKPSSANSSPSQHKSSHREKEHSSSSRHKKHSKDKRSEKDRHSSSGHKTSSSTSMKYHYSSKSSSAHKVSSTSSDHHHHRSSSSSVHKSRHSSKNGKSSRSHHESKDSHSRDHSKSKSDKSKEKSSKDKSERSKTSDDHYSSKQKWRKSTDSNDEGDSSRDEHRAGVPKDNSSSRDNATNGTLNSSNTSSGNSAANNPSEGITADTLCSNNVISQNIVILDDLLENPKTNFIEIGNAHFQVNSTVVQAPHCSYDGEWLYYFENSKSENDFERRINMLTHKMEDIRRLLQTSLDFPRKLSTTESEENTSFEMERGYIRPNSASPSGCATKRHFESPNPPPSLTSATLTIDCIQYGNTSASNCLSKRFKFNGTTVTKVSPTPSELSVNSKENEFVDKNALSDSESSGYPDSTKREINKTIAEKRSKVINRNQRYSSEDLYKPRPILSQRSRRRGLDAII